LFKGVFLRGRSLQNCDYIDFSGDFNYNGGLEINLRNLYCGVKGKKIMEYFVGQRWISLMEPELGSGIVKKIDGARLHLFFDEGNTTRIYSMVSAPIKRVLFKIGDKITSKNGKSLKVEKIEEDRGVLVYYGNNLSIEEKDVSSKINFNSPIDKLRSGKRDVSTVFDLRYRSYMIKNKILKSEIRGLIGGKIDLFPHQIYISNEVSNRIVSRALLADEVGLGKTIEAALILHRFIITRQVERVLIIVPESLTYQWFSELLKRFNLIFRIVNLKYSISLGNENPFLDGDLCLTSIDFLTRRKEKKEELLSVEWDMVIVDEIHNFKEGTENFDFISKLLSRVPKVILLTATPEQFGIKSHFERLKLLDPDRYSDYSFFLKETEEYVDISKLAGIIIDNKKMTTSEYEKLSNFLGDKYFDFFRDNEDIIKDLLDRHGVGRVMFRNTRKTIKNFPERRVHIVKVKDKIDFLCETLSKNKNEKFLLICKEKDKVIEIGDSLKKRGSFKFSFFHEDLKVIERDRNAAWFSLPEGSQILLCSEIGSEGRNFQFASNLILFDLPKNPEILEQRIGRLDRIGQKEFINIYIPCLENDKEFALARWYDEGLNALKQNIPDGEIIYEAFKDKLENLDFNNLEKIIEDTKKLRQKNSRLLEEGRDRLLELNSFNAEKASSILSRINDWEEDSEIEEYMRGIFDFFGINDNPIDERTYVLTPGDLKTDAFPKIDEEGTIISYNRQRALKNEKIIFMNPDHPYVERSIDLMLGGDYGNASIAFWFSNEKENIFIETIFILECVAPPELHIDKFMPPTPIRVLTDINMNDCTNEYPFEIFEFYLKEDKILANRFLEDEEFFTNELPEIIKKNEDISLLKSEKIIENAIKDMKKYYESERDRTEYLKKINPGVKDEEIYLINKKTSDLELALKDARARFDSVRIVWRRK